MKKNQGITLIALVITIILLLILVGVVLTLTLGKNGIINLAKVAKNEYENSERNEINDLDKLYSSIKIANGSTITLTQEQLDEYINQKVQEKIAIQPTGIKTDTYVRNQKTTTSAFSTVTSMTGFTRTADENNKIEEYLSYSDTDGYTVQKSGWYFIKIKAYAYKDSAHINLLVWCFLNNVAILEASSEASANTWDNNCDSVSVYLKQGDKVYFAASGAATAKSRDADCYIYPMF